MQNLVDGFANALLLNDDGVQLFDIRYLCVSPALTLSNLSQTVIRLEGTYVQLYMKFDLKMQNRTVTVTTDDSVEEVNNAPIYGKAYFGPGVGTRLKGTDSTVPITANVNTGVIVQGGATFGNSLSEPLDYQYFANVSRIGKIKMDGGQLKTSQLIKNVTFQFGNLMNIINTQQNDGGSVINSGDKSYVPGKLAGYRFFAVEKMLDANPAGALTNVQVAFEHNCRMSARIKIYPQNSTGISFVKNRI